MSGNLALIIEDDFDLSDIFGESLKAAGYDIEVIRDGADAQQRLKEIIPHIVILDMHLPHVDGGTLLTQMRASEALKDVTVVIVTADALMGDMYRDQADFVFIKPTTFTQLRDFTSRLKPKS